MWGIESFYQYSNAKSYVGARLIEKAEQIVEGLKLSGELFPLFEDIKGYGNSEDNGNNLWTVLSSPVEAAWEGRVQKVTQVRSFGSKARLNSIPSVSYTPHESRVETLVSLLTDESTKLSDSGLDNICKVMSELLDLKGDEVITSNEVSIIPSPAIKRIAPELLKKYPEEDNKIAAFVKDLSTSLDAVDDKAASIVSSFLQKEFNKPVIQRASPKDNLDSLPTSLLTAVTDKVKRYGARRLPEFNKLSASEVRAMSKLEIVDNLAFAIMTQAIKDDPKAPRGQGFVHAVLKDSFHLAVDKVVADTLKYLDEREAVWLTTAALNMQESTRAR